jgi:hypothetical protein
MSDQPFNNWQLRAAAANVRSTLQIARYGTLAGAVCMVFAYQFNQGQLTDVVPSWVMYALFAAGPLVSALAAIPALRVKCPKCGGRYCSFTGIYRKTGNMPPCNSCGFDVEGYIPRYG